MNICILAPSNKVDWFGNIRRVLRHSIIDMGLSLVSYPGADIVIAIQYFPPHTVKDGSKKYILYQIEQYDIKTAAVESYYAFEPDEIWGFDINNKKEKYVPLGYHPCLGFSTQSQDIDVSFMGCITERRQQWFSRVKHIPKQSRGFNHEDRGKAISRTKINLNLHAYKETQFTEWDRISHFLANGCFFISENFYCPIKIPQFDSITKYDELVDFYLGGPEERAEWVHETQKIYKRNFDMRDILDGLLR